MAESYTGTEGDTALAAGMDVMDGTEQADDIDAAINKTRDYIAERTAAITPVDKGGTGANTAAGARTNLGVQTTVDKVTNATASNVADTIMMRNAEGKVSVATPTGTENVANKGYVDGAVAAKEDSAYVRNRLAAAPSSPQPIYNPHGRANPVSTSWVAAALQGDGRLGIQPSSIRFKTLLGDFTGSALELQPVLYILDDDANAEERVGFIAEQVHETLPQGVVLDDAGVPLALHLDAIVAALVADVRVLAARVAELEAKHATN